MIRVLCIGHAAYDITLPIDSFPIENKKVRIGKGVECGGGAAANAAYLLAKWGMNTYFAGSVGNDEYGSKIIKEFEEIGVNINFLETSDLFSTTKSYILANSSNGSRTIIVSRTKDVSTTTKDIDFNPEVILVDGEELELSKRVLLENPNSISVIDAGNLKPSIVELSKLVKYLVCSQDFAEDYTKMKMDFSNFSSIIPIYEKLVNDFKNIVVITIGDKGVFLKDNGSYKVIPTLKVKAIDSTAAGDIFHGSFTYFISNGYSLVDAIKYSNAAGALSVTKIGGKNSMPNLDEVLFYGNKIC